MMNQDTGIKETLVIDETPYRTAFTEKYKTRKPWIPPNDRKITAFLPGTIHQVLVGKGDQVAEGQTVIRFEAMKMINNIQALTAGQVKDVYVKTGDKFPKGFVLMELE